MAHLPPPKQQTEEQKVITKLNTNLSQEYRLSESVEKINILNNDAQNDQYIENFIQYIINYSD